uniref:Protein sleepless n=1 Tax=Plectus sambesii TaxID=2011161 RepID=A0A914ULN5_9BILA
MLSHAVALLLLLSLGNVDAILCFSCASANTADKWGANSSWRHMYKNTPLNITDDCLTPGPLISTVECESSCFGVTYTERVLTDCDLIANYTIRGCVDRMFDPILSQGARNKTGCQSSKIDSEDTEKHTEICYCKENYCNTHNGFDENGGSKSSSVWIAISCLIVVLLLASLIGCYWCRWRRRHVIRERKPYWVAGIFPAHADHDTISLMRVQCETAKV